jgi:hypothetical protein
MLRQQHLCFCLIRVTSGLKGQMNQPEGGEISPVAPQTKNK